MQRCQRGNVPGIGKPDQLCLAAFSAQLVRQLLAVLGFHHPITRAVDQQEWRFVAIDEIHGLRSRPLLARTEDLLIAAVDDEVIRPRETNNARQFARFHSVRSQVTGIGAYQCRDLGTCGMPGDEHAAWVATVLGSVCVAPRDRLCAVFTKPGKVVRGKVR